MSTTASPGRSRAQSGEPVMLSGVSVERRGGRRPVPRPVAASVDELLAGATVREPFVPAEPRSASRFERVVLHGRPHVVKYVDLDADFTMRVTGDVGCRPVTAWAAGLLDLADDLVDCAMVGAARGVGYRGWGGALLMRDVSAELVPPGDEPLPLWQHESFLHALAGMCARTWGWRDDVGLLPYATRWRFFDVAALEGERDLGWPERVPRLAADGWERFAARAPRDVAQAVAHLRRDVTPLSDALAATPSCLLHGDWKAANLGTAADGRTVLVDWAYVGEGPACHELGWYLALNSARLPPGCGRQQTIERFRQELQGHGVDTDGWWDRQLELALLGTLVQFGWEKAFGDADELGWWCDRARDGLQRL